jgi:hypothetical protein
LAAQTITGSVTSAVCEKHVDGTRHVVIRISLPAGAYPVEKASTAAAPDITNAPSLPTLVDQSIDATIDDATGVISEITFTP